MESVPDVKGMYALPNIFQKKKKLPNILFKNSLSMWECDLGTAAKASVSAEQVLVKQVTVALECL